MKSNHISMVMFVALFFAMCFGLTTFASNAQAEDYRWEISVGGGYGGYMDYDRAHDSYDTHFDHGFALMVTAGYRFTNWFSLNVEQSLIRGWRSDGFGGEHEMHTPSDWVVGDTALTAKFIYQNDAKDFEAFFKIGVGGVYGNSDIRALSIPLGVGVNYYFNTHVGLGFDVQYDVGFADFVFLDWSYLKATLHVAFRF